MSEVVISFLEVCDARALMHRDDSVVRTHEAKHLASDFLDEVWVGLLAGEERNVALELGAHGFEAFDLKL